MKRLFIRFQNWIYFHLENNPALINKMLFRVFLAAGLSVPSLILISFWPSSMEHGTAVESISDSRIQEPIQPIPVSLNLDFQKVELGEKLFNDVRLSKDNTVSCAACHNLKTGGVDRLKVPKGINNAEGSINAPTVFNSGFNFRQFWDGRAANLEAQAEGPVHNPKEMGSSWKEVIEKLNSDEDYKGRFKLIFRSEIRPEHIQSAIAEFERSLYTPNSRFDQFLRGDRNAITQEELEGYKIFKNNGCISCHQGMNVGGNMYQTFGVTGDYFANRGNLTEADFGVYNVTKQEDDKFRFKVPSLRNVALTAPYLHDGNAPELEDAVLIMSRYQLGRTFEKEEIDKVVKFLKTLTGEYKGKKL